MTKAALGFNRTETKLQALAVDIVSKARDAVGEALGVRHLVAVGIALGGRPAVINLSQNPKIKTNSNDRTNDRTNDKPTLTYS